MFSDLLEHRPPHDKKHCELCQKLEVELLEAHQALFKAWLALDQIKPEEASPMTEEQIAKLADYLAVGFITEDTKLPVDGKAHHNLVNHFIFMSKAHLLELATAQAENTRLRAVLASHGISF